MSQIARDYARSLQIAPNNEPVNGSEKLVLMLLADYHQDRAGRLTYPSVETIAADSCVELSTCKRALASLERKGVIKRLRPPQQGRGMRTYYFLPEIEQTPEGWEQAAELLRERSAKGVQKGGERGAEGGRSAPPLLEERAQEREPEQEQEQKQTPPNPLAGEGEPVGTVQAHPRREEPAEDSEGIEAALEPFCEAHSFTARRLRRKLRGVMVARMHATGRTAAAVAAEMGAAWTRYTAQGPRLFRHVSAAEFFEGGLWLNENSWPWDAAYLREERAAQSKPRADIPAAPSPAQWEARQTEAEREEREAFETWQGMNEAYRRANPWQGRTYPAAVIQ